MVINCGIFILMYYKVVIKSMNRVYVVFWKDIYDIIVRWVEYCGNVILFL